MIKDLLFDKLKSNKCQGCARQPPASGFPGAGEPQQQCPRLSKPGQERELQQDAEQELQQDVE